MKEKTHLFDIVIAGGGFAGVCAAISAARNGARVVLVEQRHMLGGNGSSLIRVHVGGACHSGWQFDARECGIIEEIRLAYAVKDPLNSYAWIDQVLHDACVASGVTIVYETTIDEVTTASLDSSTGHACKITEIRGTQRDTETRHVFKGKVFVDSTGDGTLGALAGAEFRWGREGKAEFGESIAPDVPDEHTLGSSIMFQAKDMGKPVMYIPPPWAKKLPDDYSDKNPHRRPGKSDNRPGIWHGDGVGYWWIEYGGMLNTIDDNETIKQELLAILHGVWDHVKNSGDWRYKDQARNYDLTWVGQIPGKRESRRLVGDYILVEQDVVAGTLFEDQIATGGWSIDLHPPEGFYAPGPPAVHGRLSDLYTIPFRSVYSKNVENLFIGSRCLSVSHVAHGTTRLIATLAAVGQAVGLAAARCVALGTNPRMLARKHFKEYQQELLKQDGFLYELQNVDTKDKARGATVIASSEHEMKFTKTDAWIPCAFPIAMQFCVDWQGKDILQDKIRFFMKNGGAESYTMKGGLRAATKLGDFGSKLDVTAFSMTVPPRFEGWTRASFDKPVVLARKDDMSSKVWWWWLGDASGDVSIGKCSSHYPGTRTGFFDEDAGTWSLARHGDGATFFSPVVKPRGVFTFALDGIVAYPATNVVNGFHRPGRSSSNQWRSSASGTFPQYLELDVSKDGAGAFISEIHLTLDTRLDKAYPHVGYGLGDEWKTPGKAPECAKDITVGVESAGQWITVADVKENFLRKHVFRFPTVKASKVRVDFHAVHEGTEVAVYEIRVY